MFDLEKAIATWRRAYEVNPTFSDEDLEELEGSLRDRIDVLSERMTEQEAFEIAVRRIGSLGKAETEYKKVYWGKLRREHRLADELIFRMSMFKNYFLIAMRTLRKQKGYTAINIFGLAIGLTCFLLISLFVRFELSYDTFHEKADRIYRVVKEDPGGFYLGTNHYAVTSAPVVAALMDEFPEVEYAAQIESIEVLLRLDEDSFYEEGVYATRHFFDVFSFELLQGDPGTALVEPNAIILTESLAQKYFGTTDPMGRTLSYIRAGKPVPMTVTGIVADPPPNSHFSFDCLFSMTTSDNYRRLLAENHWDSNNYLTYVSLHPDYDLAAFEDKLIALAQEYLSRIDYYQRNPDRISIYYPQALTDIHLHSHLNFEIGDNGDIKYVYLFSAIGLLILLIACINYMNLATARSVMRAKEVGVRKVMGARRMQLVGQFMSEATILSVVAMGIAVLLVYLLLPVFNTLTAREMALTWTEQSGLWLAVVGIGLGVGLVAGSYPALVLSGFAPVSVMKGVLKNRTGKARLRHVLVVAQFAITTVLIVGTIAIYQQLHYIQTANTGVDRDHVVTVPVKDLEAREQYEAIKHALEQHPGVVGVTASRSTPVEVTSQSGATEWEGAEEGQRISVYHMPVQHGFAELFGIEIMAGRDLSEEIGTDERQGMLINETMMQQLGWDHETAIGKWFNFGGRELRIVGVMKDFNFLSFHQAMAPLAFYLGEERNFSRLLVKVRPERMQETIAHLETTMSTFAPAYPFEYEFLDDAYNSMYRTEVRLGTLFSYFTILALAIACLGLLGLAAFMAAQRTKEIGVRKVLGASLSDILLLLSSDFVKLVGLGFVIAAPVAYLALQRWLDDFAFHIELGPGLFIAAGASVLFVALATVSYQSIRAALADPVQSLRYE